MVPLASQYFLIDKNHVIQSTRMFYCFLSRYRGTDVFPSSILGAFALTRMPPHAAQVATHLKMQNYPFSLPIPQLPLPTAFMCCDIDRQIVMMINDTANWKQRK